MKRVILISGCIFLIFTTNAQESRPTSKKVSVYDLRHNSLTKERKENKIGRYYLDANRYRSPRVENKMADADKRDINTGSKELKTEGIIYPNSKDEQQNRRLNEE